MKFFQSSDLIRKRREASPDHYIVGKPTQRDQYSGNVRYETVTLPVVVNDGNSTYKVGANFDGTTFADVQDTAGVRDIEVAQLPPEVRRAVVGKGLDEIHRLAGRYLLLGVGVELPADLPPTAARHWLDRQIEVVGIGSDQFENRAAELATEEQARYDAAAHSASRLREELLA